MKQLQFLFTIFFFLGYYITINAQITLSSQSEVDAWDQSITVLTEDVIITGSDITNIDALSNLIDIESELEIKSNINLTNIDGLSGLNQITGKINLNNNDALTDLDGFLGLTNFEGTIILQLNDGFTNLNGLSNLQNISGRIFISRCNGLTNLNGFSGLEDFSGLINITNCDALTDFGGLPNLSIFSGSIELNNNDGLTNLAQFSNYTDIIGDLTIRNSANITNIDVFSSLTDVSGSLTLWTLPMVTDLVFLSGITELTGDIRISDNENLTSIDGLSNLSVINGELIISSNENLTNIDGLSNLSEVNGVLSISSNENLENINGLSGLSDIIGVLAINNNDALLDLNVFFNFTNISGSLIIDDNDGIINLDDLSSLTELTGSITISDNIALVNTNGLLGLTDISGTMTIRGNDTLVNIQGLSNLTDISGTLNVNSNSSLANINGFLGLINITGRVNLSGNEILNDLNGLSNLSTLDGILAISINEGLTNLDGLNGLHTIIGRLYLTRNNSLENIDGLSGLSDLRPGSTLGIEQNESLTNIDGLSGLINADGNLFISKNHALTNIDGLSVLSEVSTTADIRILENNSLTNLDGFSNLTHIRRHLYIIDNNSLPNIDGFSNLEQITNTGHLDIRSNDNLQNIDGLSSLKSITSSGRLTLQDNNSLSNLNGFYNLEQVSGRITVSDNDLLSNCCGLSDAIEIGDPWVFIIDTNQVNCNSSTEILDACSLTLNYDQTRPCEAVDNGRINFFTSDFDTLPFTYQWEELNLNLTGSSINNNDQFSIENLPAGTYNVTVTLPNGAREIIQDIVLDPIIGSIFEITKLTSTNSTNGEPSGTLYLEFSGGTAPYSLSWTGPVSGTRSDISTEFYTIFGLAAGEYTVQITDANAQSKLVNITLLDEVVPIFPCTEPLDIVILNDVSGSVNPTEYSESKTFFVDLLRIANIGEDTMDSQAAIIEWSSNPQQALMVPLTGNIQELESYELATRAFNQGTSPHPAMQFGADYIEENGRDGVEKVLILSTDGNPTSSLVALADEFKARGYHIITIAFDYAYYVGNVRDILTQVASISLLAPGAPSYAQLDEDLVDNIINRYICPLDPGSSSSVYFNRDGAIQIDSASTNCPITGFVEVTFTVSAYRELSIPVGTSVMFYHNDPLLFGATPILDFKLPCAIPVGTSETYTVTLPINSATKLYALLNDDGTDTPPLNYPITDLEEIAYSNNIDTISICINDQPTLQALKYTTTPTPICDSILMYTIDVCNIGTTDAFDVIISDQAPLGASFISLTVNTNNCSTNNEDSYDIPADCCVSLSLTYNSSAVPEGYYGQQNVILSGPIDQEYVDYNGSLSSAEDVIIREGDENCPSTNILFTKEVDKNQVCEDGFLVYTYTIHNETNSVIQGAKFIDILPDPMEWVYNPYAMSGLSITPPGLSGSTAEFVIDEILADTLATFQIDAYTGDWSSDGIITTFATLENVIDLENGGIQTLESNEVSTNINSNFPCDSLWSNSIDLEMFLSVEAFPNPTTGRIQFTNLTEPVNYKIYNSIGELYKTGIMKEESLQLDFKGINLIQLSLSSGEMKTFKLIRIGSGW